MRLVLTGGMTNILQLQEEHGGRGAFQFMYLKEVLGTPIRSCVAACQLAFASGIRDTATLEARSVDSTSDRYAERKSKIDGK